ncbi:MAG TPA: LacI family DNA-binding transcriptional regulator [Phycisphaerae bacterium]|nr:LacI family DNA-binding transcriptional regulator [Phycisphaerae bacterium]HOJ75106.1 LacI family DNA-binding transcriptional regulator [Phycisphaerae bacterium]HOM53491.1 LacI family DNA-binding transcriptional regulator [Phycisphaerae bacterium]HON68304.1 LacI family DNA-binding transcriptional regulator [Phycisphaerae bacterium]HOQ86521.1 LacI family DNA-binding transcriptional regulator [Phycisphaerae bacterium]
MGSRAPTTAEQIAAKLNLSRTTVSLVLNGRGEEHRISPRTISRVVAAAKEANYVPNVVARQLAGKRSNAVGVLIATAAIADTRMIQMMEIMASERGIRFIIGHAVGPQNRIREYLQDFRSRGVDALVSVFHNHPDYRDVVLPELARFRNVVFYERPDFNGRAPVERPCYVEPDFRAVGRLGVQHLLDIGRRRIGLVFNNLAFSYAVQRYEAYCQTLAAANIPVDDALVWALDRQPGLHWTDSFTNELADAAVETLVVQHKADAIVAVNDSYAARVVAALHRRGFRVPDDVAIVGCDNLEVGSLVEPPLTTFDMELEALARAQVDMIFKLVDQGVVPEEQRAVVIQPRLIVRESTQAC